jgi:hypothetical protein
MLETSEEEYNLRRDSLVIALISFAVIVFEIGITRLLSVVLWYHFAFLAISLAMLALGAPGVWFSQREPRPGLLRGCMLGGSLAIPTSISLVAKIGEWSPVVAATLNSWGLELEPSHLRVGLTAVILLVPFLFMGAAVCQILMRAPGSQIGRVYAADLGGAALGAAAIVPLLHWIPTPPLLAGLGLLTLAAAVIIAPSRRVVPLAMAAVIAASLVWGAPYQVEVSKSYPEAIFDRVYEKWTPTARLTVFRRVFWEGKKGVAFGWGMGSRYEPKKLEQLWIEQDGSAGTPITRYSGKDAEIEHLFFDVTSVGYQLRKPERVCIIGAGGGRDILTALRSGARNVDAVELNPAMIDIATRVYGDFSGEVYSLPGVRSINREGRNHLTRTPERYDLIQISLIDSWAATSAGAYALSENYLYTLESMQLYWSRLTDHGIVSISRWMQGDMQMEGVRLALLAADALERKGIETPLDHVAILQGGYVATLLMSRDPFEPEALARLDAISAERGFTRHWPPGPGAPVESLVIDVLTAGPAKLEDRGLFLDPPTDDRPFFFQSVRAFGSVEEGLMDEISVNDDAGRLPRFLISTVLVLTLLLFFSPFLFFRRQQRSPGFWRSCGYFLSIGVAFMLVEIPFIQRFILYLGHPSYATTVVLSTLLLGSGIGSALASRIDSTLLFRLRWLLPLAVALVNLAAAPFIDFTIGWTLAARVTASILAMGPLGFFMGFAFPTGMMGAGESDRAWFWALNGAASVLASASCVALAAYIGFSGIVWLGVAGYAGACMLIPRQTRIAAP